jgi:hypothetical protein
MKKNSRNLTGQIDLELPYSHGLLLKYGLIKNRTEAPAVMRAMQRVVKHPSVKKKRAKGFIVETILRQMSKRQLATLHKAVSR